MGNGCWILDARCVGIGDWVVGDKKINLLSCPGIFDNINREGEKVCVDKSILLEFP